MAANSVIGALRVVLGADTAAFDDGLKSAQSRLSAFGASMGKAGAVIGGAMVAAAAAVGVALKGAIDQADALGKAAQKIGIPVEELSKLQHAADLADVSLEQLSTGVVRLSKNMGEIAGGKTTSAAADAFAALGIKVTDTNGKLKATDQIISEVASKFEGFRDGASKTALAVALFGKSGAELIPLLNQGAAGINKAKKEAEDLGLVIDTQTAKAAEEFNDNLKTLSKSADVLFIRLAALASGPLAELTRRMIEARTEGTAANSFLTGFITVLGAIFPVATNAGRALAGAMQASKNEAAGLKISLEDVGKAVRGLGADKPDAPIIIDRDKLAKEMAAFDAANTRMLEHFTALQAEGQAILERFATPAEALAIEIAKIDEAFLKGALTVEQWGLVHERVMERARDQAAEAAGGIAGNFAKAFEFLAGKNEAFAVAYKAAAIAEAGIATYLAANKIMAQTSAYLPPPGPQLAAAAVIAAGLANVAKIASAAKGGSFMVPGGISGTDNRTIPLNLASGERVDITPANEVARGRGGDVPREVMINVRGPIPRSYVEQILQGINDAIGDGHSLKLSAA